MRALCKCTWTLPTAHPSTCNPFYFPSQRFILNNKFPAFTCSFSNKKVKRGAGLEHATRHFLLNNKKRLKNSTRTRYKHLHIIRVGFRVPNQLRACILNALLKSCVYISDCIFTEGTYQPTATETGRIFLAVPSPISGMAFIVNA